MGITTKQDGTLDLNGLAFATDDVFASVANYFEKKGKWERGGPVMQAAVRDASAADFATDHRGSHHLAAAFFEQDDRHALADVLAGHVTEDARALRVQREVHGGFLGLAVKAGLRIGEVFASQQHVALDDDGLAVAFGVTLGAEGHRAGAAFGRLAFG